MLADAFRFSWGLIWTLFFSQSLHIDDFYVLLMFHWDPTIQTTVCNVFSACPPDRLIQHAGDHDQANSLSSLCLHPGDRLLGRIARLYNYHDNEGKIPNSCQAMVTSGSLFTCAHLVQYSPSVGLMTSSAWESSVLAHWYSNLKTTETIFLRPGLDFLNPRCLLFCLLESILYLMLRSLHATSLLTILSFSMFYLLFLKVALVKTTSHSLLPSGYLPLPKQLWQLVWLMILSPKLLSMICTFSYYWML